MFSRIEVRDGHVAGWEFQPPFDALLDVPDFEYGSLVVVMPPDTNHGAAVPGEPLPLGARRRRATCRDEVLAAMRRLEDRTGETVFTVARVFDEMHGAGTAYKHGAVAKTMQRMRAADPVSGECALERAGGHGFRLARDL